MLFALLFGPLLFGGALGFLGTFLLPPLGDKIFLILIGAILIWRTVDFYRRPPNHGNEAEMVYGVFYNILFGALFGALLNSFFGG